MFGDSRVVRNDGYYGLRPEYKVINCGIGGDKSLNVLYRTQNAPRIPTHGATSTA